jgi:hypothetical protein
MKAQVFWDVVGCCWVSSSRRFERSFCVPQGQTFQSVLLGLLDPEDEGTTLLRNFGNCSFHKSWLFSNTAVRTSNIARILMFE